jgi:hypothetical protein
MSNFLKDSIRIADGFQYSVNIGFDINNDEKIKDFIPTTALLEIMEEILLSTHDNSTDRARILIGAYGKGKSHLVLVLLSLLMGNKSQTVFERLFLSIKEYNQNLYEYVKDYLGNKKLLPVVIQSNATSLTQAFLGAIQKALDTEELADLLPDTHFQAALSRVEDWQDNYPQTYDKFIALLNEPVSDFIYRLSDFDSEAYELFCKIYPQLTSGSVFNPLFGSDVIELYSQVTEKLCDRGYNGIFVVYDEFSKFLEAGINQVSAIDIKLLQDFAEKCNRSKDKQMHLLLISHKDIANYIEKLPKHRVDGWRGVSERFTHLEIHNNFSQVYDIIATIINQDKNRLVDFFKGYQDKFLDLQNDFANLFTDLIDKEMERVVKDCYPLHPITTFILPRLSEKVAQNERTLFTFLASKNKNTLSTFIEQTNNDFPMLTPDLLYDYFEPLLKKEVYTSDIHKLYLLVTSIVSRLESDLLGTKIVKTIALIYIIAQFEKLPPTSEIIIKTFQEMVTDISEITKELQLLIEKHFVIYLNRSDNYLKLKDNVGVNVGEKIANEVEKVKSVYRMKDIFNNASFDNYLYPVSYNDSHAITHYFDFVFIDSTDFFGVENWEKKSAATVAEGVVYGIIPKDAEDIVKISEVLSSNQCICEGVVFILPQKETDIEKTAFEYQAAISLKKEAEKNDDRALIEEYDIRIDDLSQVIDRFVAMYLKPETRQAGYYYRGEKQNIYRKAQISQLLSTICEEVYSDTPIINNEAINKDFLPTVAINSRSKVIAGLLNNKLEPALGLSGTGQEVSVLRSTLVMTGILADWAIEPKLIVAGNSNEKIQHLLDEITRFFKESNQDHPQNFQILYDRLTKAENRIGLKKGIIPIYIAVVLHSMKQYAVIIRGNRELEINPDLLNSINENPSEYSFCLEGWNEDKTKYINELEELFTDYIVAKEKEYNSFSYIVRAMQRWFISLPKYAKELKKIYVGQNCFNDIEKSQLKFINSLKTPEINAREYLFVKLLDIFGYQTVGQSVVAEIRVSKYLLDEAKQNLKTMLVNDVRNIFADGHTDRVSFASIIKDWYDGLRETTRNYLFNSGVERILGLFKEVTNDESHFIDRLAKGLTGLRVDDWTENTVSEFIKDVKVFKQNVEEKDTTTEESSSSENAVYKLVFVGKDQTETVKTFNKTERSPRSQLLYNDLAATIEEHGESISENEKRQVLMDLIERLCK